MSKPVSLTGIKPTGIPHIGNYLGAIKPALNYTDSHEAVYFIADYHALTTVWKGEDMRHQIHSVAATWLALGLDPETCHFYKQSDVPEIFELNWVLSCFTPKGFMNRAHGYKDKVAKNQEAGRDADEGVNMGLYGYPCLMNADILMFGANIVPVGKDQKQHVEFTRDIATRFNKNYKQEVLTIPEPVIDELTDVIPGMDGRKMSKSYDNTIEIFLSSKKLKKKVNKIVTNSQEMEEVKDPETCNVFALYKFFASEDEQSELAEEYRAGGMGWGAAKAELHRVLDREFAEAREKYDHLMANTHEIDAILAKGAEKARVKARELMDQIRGLVGVG
jgi:tryptophanyl-tRNA synthetase